MEGHGDLIDKNYLLSILQCEEYDTCTWRNCSECNREKSIKRQTILEAPTIVASQPKIGHWILTNDYYTGAYGSIDYVECSCCHEYSLEEGYYCPNCGAKMERSDEK